MSTSDKRRGGSGHAMRAGQSHARRQNSPARPGGSAAGQSKDAVTSNGGGSGMPAPPPKAAMVKPGSPNPDESLDSSGTATAGGGVTLTEHKEKDKDPSSPRRGSGSTRDKHQRDRDAATAAIIREKDERIAQLEEEKADMEDEFEKELDKHSQNESETTVHWQKKHSELHSQFLQADFDLRMLRKDSRAWEAERDELRSGWEVLRGELRERDDEVRSLRGQIRGLKEFVSTSTRTDGQTSDEVFGDAMTRLGNGLQNWVIVHFRKAKLDLSKVDEATLAEVGELVPMYEELASTAKVHLLQSLVSQILVEMVFDAYYVGLSEEQTGQIRQIEDLLSSYAKSEESINQWRSSTLALLRRESPGLHNETGAFTEAVIGRINRVLDSLLSPGSSSSAPAPAPEARDAALRVLVNNAVELSRLLKAQKAVLRAHMPVVVPHQRTPFERGTMEDMGGEEDEDGLEEREICCVVFPGLIKRGDETGGHMQYRNVITKARVLCGPEGG